MTPPSDSTLTGGTLSLGKKNIIPTRAELAVRQDLSLPIMISLAAEGDSGLHALMTQGLQQCAADPLTVHLGS